LEPKHFEKFVLFVFEKFQEPNRVLNALFGLLGHDFFNSNTHYFTTECKYAVMALAQNPDFNVKYVNHEEFYNDNSGPINIDVLDKHGKGAMRSWGCLSRSLSWSGNQMLVDWN
jgi:hypothetical protein